MKSISSQKYSNLEVIIQDGGSTDNSLEIIEKYAKKRAFNYEYGEDKGQLDAINKGFKKASGDILTYINADDLYENGALKSVAEVFEKKPKTLWLAGKGKVIDANGKEISKFTTWYKNILLRLNSFTFLLGVNYLVQPSVFLSKSCFKKDGPFQGWKGRVLEYEMWLKIGKKQMPFVLNKNLSLFRLTKESITGTFYRQILDKDYAIVSKFTSNPAILFLHWLNNVSRIVWLFLLNI